MIHANMFEILAGDLLNAVTFVHSYLQFQFDSTPRLNAYNPVTVQSGGLTANQGEPLFPSLLVGQIGKRVQSVEFRENEALRLIFEDASVIAVSLKSADYIGPEAVNLFQDDGVTVVE